MVKVTYIELNLRGEGGGEGCWVSVRARGKILDGHAGPNQRQQEQHRRPRHVVLWGWYYSSYGFFVTILRSEKFSFCCSPPVRSPIGIDPSTPRWSAPSSQATPRSTALAGTAAHCSLGPFTHHCAHVHPSFIQCLSSPLPPLRPSRSRQVHPGRNLGLRSTGPRMWTRWRCKMRWSRCSRTASRAAT